MSAVHFFGTSNSILRPGYIENLEQMLADKGIPLYNRSVGESTSVMGLMRLHQCLENISVGDVVVWEYPILDVMLRDFYGESEITNAYRMAWTLAAEKGAQIVVVYINPLQALLNRADDRLARQIEGDVRMASLGWVTMRDTMVQNGIVEPSNQAEHYGGGDGHLIPGSVMIGAFADAIYKEILNRVGAASDGLFHKWGLSKWTWVAPSSFNSTGETEIIDFSNRFLTVSTVKMRPENIEFQFPIPARRVVALGLVTTHHSGAVWCGHIGCAPASTRLSPLDGHPFLLQQSRLSCVRGRIDSLQAAPPHAMKRTIWADATVADCHGEGDSAPVNVFGALVEPAE